MTTHRNVSYRIAQGAGRTRNVQVTTEGDLSDEAVNTEVAQVLAATHQVPISQVTLLNIQFPRTVEPEPEPKKPTRREIHDLKKAELIDLITSTEALAGIDTDGTVKTMEQAVFERLGI